MLLVFAWCSQTDICAPRLSCLSSPPLSTTADIKPLSDLSSCDFFVWINLGLCSCHHFFGDQGIYRSTIVDVGTLVGIY